MIRILVRFWLVAAVLAAVGWSLRALGTAQQQTAAAQQRVLTLEFDAAGPEVDGIGAALARLPQVAGVTGIAQDLRAQAATSQYWQRQYGDLTVKTSASGEVIERDPAMLLIAANAAYRRASREESSPNAVASLDAVVGQYADLLRRGDWQFDAAYNYEFASRRRDALIKARSARPAERRELPKPPSTTTLHGEAGAVPPGTDMSDFKIVVPQRSDERREQPEAGKGGPKQRKG